MMVVEHVVGLIEDLLHRKPPARTATDIQARRMRFISTRYPDNVRWATIIKKQ
jgi:hypothetical protein